MLPVNNDTFPVLPSSPDGTDQLSPALIALRTTYIVVASLAIICVNVLTLAVMLRVRGEFPPGSTKLVMCSLALSDLGIGIMTIFYIPLSAMDRWPFNTMWPCTLMRSILGVLCSASILNLVLLSFDRLIAITKPLLYPTLLPQRRMMYMTVFQWVSCTIFGAVAMATVQPDVRYNQAAALCLLENDKDNLSIDVICFCTAFLLPVMIMLGIYIKLIHTSYTQAKKINTVNVPSNPSPEGGKNAVKAGSGKAVKLFCVIVTVYTVSWMPHSSLQIHGDLNPDRIPPWLEFISAWLAINNSLWNFIIYIGMNKTFRKLYFEILKDLIKQCRRCHFWQHKYRNRMNPKIYWWFLVSFQFLKWSGDKRSCWSRKY